MRKTLTVLALALALALAGTLPAQAADGPATQVVQQYVNKFLEILRDPSFKDPATKEQQRKVLSDTAAEIFDYVELSRRTLARNWNNFTPDQRKRFVELYTKLLERTYMDRIQGYSNEKVAFTGEVALDQDKSEVDTRIITADKEIPINYRLLRRDGQWRVYDVIVEGVSLVQNYRSQFDQMLANQSPDKMLDDLAVKVQQQ